MAKKELYVERRDEGDYAIRRPGSERASDVCDTQAEAIERARDGDIDPSEAIHVERDALGPVLWYIYETAKENYLENGGTTTPGKIRVRGSNLSRLGVR